MIVQTMLRGFILFTAAFVSNAEEDSVKVFTLKNAMKKFVDVFQKVYGVEVLWTDMKSERPEMKKLFATPK
uniref:Putative cytotoxin-like protein n=1 Tax=Ixodes ricinus TaxID=34613 RepID=A0A6B0U2A4_IXORI